MKHMWLWWVLNLTWGSIYSIIGLFEMLFVLIFGRNKKISRFHEAICTQFGNNWGGLSGVFFIFVADNMGDTYTKHTKCHELGHSFQNALFGPFNIFLVLIPSFVRYWAFTIGPRIHKNYVSTPYDQIWFEGSASDAGTEYVALLEEKQKKL